MQESIEAIDDLEHQIRSLEAEFKAKLDEIGDRWGDVVNNTSEVSLKPTKTNIFVDDFGVAWTPFYLVEIGGERVEVPAFG